MFKKTKKQNKIYHNIIIKHEQTIKKTLKRVKL